MVQQSVQSNMERVVRLFAFLVASTLSSAHVDYAGIVESVAERGIFEPATCTSCMCCPRNMLLRNTCNQCYATCADPSGTENCDNDCSADIPTCVCPTNYLMDGSNCVRQEDCGCYKRGCGVIANGQTCVNKDCTVMSSCVDGELVDEVQACGTNAHCIVQSGVGNCQCDDGFQGNGQTCVSSDAIYTDCYDAFTDGNTDDGIYLIKPTNWTGEAFDVSCVMSTNGGGWTVFQRRTGTDNETDFYGNWTSYRNGFGSLGRDFWLGNEKLHYLTQQRKYILRVDAVSGENEPLIGNEWSAISIGAEEDDYRLLLGKYEGTLLFSMSWNNGSAFSTHDRDNDGCGAFNCAQTHKSAWWYWGENECARSEVLNTCTCYCFEHTTMGKTRCTASNPNGMYSGGQGETPFWEIKSGEDNCDLGFIEMKIRPVI